MTGGSDPALPASAVERSRRYVTGPMESHVLTEAGHFPHEEDPAEFTALLLAWLQGVA